MKKRKELLAVLAVMSLLSFTACEIYDSSYPNGDGLPEDNSSTADDDFSSENADDSDVVAGSNTVVEFDEYSIITRDPDEIALLSPEECAYQFLSALCLNDTEMIDLYAGGSGHDDYTNVRMDSKLTSFGKNDEYLSDNYIGQAYISVHESDCDTFEVGKHQYSIIIDGNSNNGIIDYFGKKEDTLPALSIETHSCDATKADALEFLNLYISEYKADERMSDGNLNEPSYELMHILIHDIDTDESGIFDIDGVNLYLAERYGFATIDDYPEMEQYLREKCGTDIGEDTFTNADCVHGTSEIALTFDKSEWLTNSDAYTYVFNFGFYSDFARIEKCAEAVFTFTWDFENRYVTLTDVSYTKLSDLPCAAADI